MEIRFLAYLIIIFGSINLLRMALFLIGSDIYAVLHKKRVKQFNWGHIPFISIVIPGYNEERTIYHSLRSVFASNYPKSRYEVIVVDDGSKDQTSSTVEKYQKENPDHNVVLVRQENAGKANALNNGMKNYASGELVMCLDADSSIDKDALKNVAIHFADPKVAALSANVKIIKRKGLLNWIQKFEYLVCYQMKRAESLFDCEYIVGGIGSVFRKSVLEKVGYYDTNTVTEDIDLSMKILQLGNKENKVIYGADVVAYTESVLDISGLIKQRYRWKWGRCQTFLKNTNMFFSTDRKYTKSLSWFYLPFALYGDIAYFLEPILLTYILVLSILYRDPITIVSAWVVISCYMILNVLAEDTTPLKERFIGVLQAPFTYPFLYILSFVEYIALIKAILNIKNLSKSIMSDNGGWTHVERPILEGQA
jgi:poly-beta-1,6-N-acetyl-D-glucosamine synthase